jgi:hypothetical protein
MRTAQLLTSAAFAVGLAALPAASATAQYMYPPCSPFPLTWPFCIVGAAAAIVTAPIRAITGGPYYGYYGRPYYPPPPPYYPPPGAAAAYGQPPSPYYPPSGAAAAYGQPPSPYYPPPSAAGGPAESYSQPVTAQPLPPQH